MKRILWVMTAILLAIPAFAQDDFGGFDGNSISGADLDALLGGGRGGNRGGRGNNNNNNIPDPETALLQLKDLLKTHKAPLSKDQEKALRTLLETETKTMREELEAQFANRGNNQNRGNNNNNTVNVIGEVFTTVAKHNTELLTAMKTDLTPDQSSLIAKAEKDKKTCIVMLDLINVPQLESRLRGNNNNYNNNNNNNFNLPPELADLNRGGGDFNRGGGRGGNNNFNNNNNAQILKEIPDRAFCTSAASTTAERLEPFSQVLSKGKKPLTPDQEKKFSGLIEARVALMEEELKTKNPQSMQLVNQINNQNRNNNNNNNNPQQLRNNIVNTIMSQLGVPNNNNNNQGRGNRGGNNNNQNNQNNQSNQNQNNQNQNANAGNNNNNDFRGNRGNNNFNPQAEIQKKNEELLDKIAASLNADQKPIIKKFKYDQIKAKGGVERYRGILEEEGTPLTPEQTAQIQALFNSQNQAIRQATEKLVDQELANAPPQPEPAPQPQNQQGNQPNRNNVNQNPLAQQIVAKLLPQVSVQKARLEKVTQDTIMKLLTPPQVASYKLNSL